MKRLLFLFAFVILLIVPKDQVYAFSDVEKTDYFYDAVQWASKENIISGFSDDTFKPHNTVTHQQFIKMYTNSFDFKHPKSATAYQDYYSTLKQYGIEFSHTKLAEKITRGEVAVLLSYANGQLPRPYSFSTYEVKDMYELASKYLIDTKISTGQTNGNTFAAQFGVDNSLTRAQAITFLYRLYNLELNTLAENVRLYKEPPLFEEEPIRSYDVGNEVTYHVMEDGINLRLAITYKDYVIGGYDTQVGKTVHSYTIGTANQSTLSDFPYSAKYAKSPDSGYYVSTHIDEHTDNTIRAVSWWVATPSLLEHTLSAANLATATDTTNVARIYRDLANEFRLKFGEHALKEHWALAIAAKAHSVDMANRNYFSHTTPEGLSPSDRVKLVPNNHEISSAGENISAGYSTIFHSHTGWINSSGHRNNLLNPSYQYIGYGVSANTDSKYEHYYTAKFAR